MLWYRRASLRTSVKGSGRVHVRPEDQRWFQQHFSIFRKILYRNDEYFSSCSTRLAENNLIVQASCEVTGSRLGIPLAICA